MDPHHLLTVIYKSNILSCSDAPKGLPMPIILECLSVGLTRRFQVPCWRATVGDFIGTSCLTAKE